MIPEPMKLIFLDIDGVFNHRDHMIRESEHGRSTSSYHIRLDQEKIQMYARFVHEVNAQTIISSSWRLGGFEKAQSIQNLTNQLNRYGIIISGFTPITHERIRGMEIATWINRNCMNIPHFGILDDDADMEALLPHLVKTNYVGGLKIGHINRLRSVLKMEPSDAVVRYIKKEGLR